MFHTVGVFFFFFFILSFFSPPFFLRIALETQNNLRPSVAQLPVIKTCQPAEIYAALQLWCCTVCNLYLGILKGVFLLLSCFFLACVFDLNASHPFKNPQLTDACFSSPSQLLCRRVKRKRKRDLVHLFRIPFSPNVKDSFNVFCENTWGCRRRDKILSGRPKGKNKRALQWGFISARLLLARVR